MILGYLYYNLIGYLSINLVDCSKNSNLPTPLLPLLQQLLLLLQQWPHSTIL